MAFSFGTQSGCKAAVKQLKVVLFDAFEAGRKRREIFPAKQGKYRKKQGIYFNFKDFLY